MQQRIHHSANSQHRQAQSQAQQNVQLVSLKHKLDQCIENSVSLRLKYPGDPIKFYAPQQQINSILNLLLAQISVQALPQIVSSHILLPVLKVLQHPNVDLVGKAIHILYQLIIEGVPGQNQEEFTEKQSREKVNQQGLFEIYFRLCLWLFDKDILTFLSSLLGENGKGLLNQNNPQEYETVTKVLKIFNAILDSHAAASEQLISQKKELKILLYLCDRIMPNYIIEDRIIDDNKFLSSDVLIQIIQKSPSARNIFVKMHGIEIIIECLRPYTIQNRQQKHSKKSRGLNQARYTNSSDEYQFVSNLFDCLNIILSPDFQSQYALSFHSCQGPSIMLWFIKQKNEHSVLAYKVLAKSLACIRNISQINRQGAQQCFSVAQGLIEMGILKYVFPILMRQGILGKQVDQQIEIDQATLNIIYFLLTSINTEIDPQFITYRDRILSKFQQDRCKKLQKLFQMYEEYTKRVTEMIEQNLKPLLQQQTNKQKIEIEDVISYIVEENSIEYYLKLLKEGQSVIQPLVKTLIYVMAVSSQKYHPKIRQRMLELKTIYRISSDEIIQNLKLSLHFDSDRTEKQSIQKMISQNPLILNEKQFIQQNPKENGFSNDKQQDA